MNTVSIILSGALVILVALITVFRIMYLKLLRKYREAKNNSITDSLTGLYNRRFLEDALDKEIGRATRYNHDLQVMFIDLDNFKEVNSACGHDGGDDALKAVADGLRQISRRRYETLSRYGGDEFVLILPETSIDDAKKFGEKIIETIERIKINNSIKISASIGIRHFDLRNPTADLIEGADDAMYVAKNDGKGKVHIYEH